MRPSERIDGSRLWTRLMDLARFGAREDGGVDRQTLTEAEIAARAQLVSWGRALGLSPHTDAAANLFLRFEGSDCLQASTTRTARWSPGMTEGIPSSAVEIMRRTMQQSREKVVGSAALENRKQIE